MTDKTGAAKIGTVLIDDNNTILTATETAARLFGRDIDTLVGSKFQQLLSDDAAKAHERIVNEYSHHPDTASAEVVCHADCRRTNGTLFRAEISLSEIDYAGQRAFVCSIQNLDSQKLSEQNSRRLVEDMTAILNHASYGTLLLDQNLKVQHTNDAFRKMWGFEEADTRSGITAEDLRNHPDAKTICPPGNVASIGSEKNKVTEIRRDDGRILERRCALLPADNILLTYYDITDIALKAESAKSNADRRTYAMQAADQAFWDWNLFTDKMIVGERFWLQIQRMYLGPEISSEDFFNLVHQEDREFLEYTLRAFASGEVEDTVGAVDTFRINTPDGEERHFALGFSVVESDATPYLTGLIRDITEPRRLRRAITEARDEAREANRAKSDFLATMSHEIRTPMNGILGMAGLLLDSTLDATQHDYALVVKESGESLLTIINDILDYSKFEAGRLELECIEFDLQSVIEGACRLLAPRAHGKNLELETKISGDLPHVLEGDPGRLRQVVLNLIGNAIKFTDSGAITLRTIVIDQDSETARIRVEVIDTGIGVPEDKQHRLFEKFSQADSSVNRRYGGTGLGLAICKSLISLMDGEIGVINNSGAGSTFWFEIPFSIAPEPPVAATSGSDIAGLRICVVSEDDRDRNHFQSLFGSWNMAVEATASDQHAVKLIRQGTQTGTPFDFAILEINSASVDPVAFAKSIQDDPETAATHLILATSSGVRGDAAQMKEAGFSAYITKPVERTILYQILSELAASRDDRDTPWLTKHLVAEHGRRQLHVLVAEDNPVNQKLILALLDKLGHKARLAKDGVEVMTMIGQNNFDVLLMDIMMPNKSGIEAAEEIRAMSGEIAQIPIIALTASTAEEDIALCRAAGMNDFLGKPIDPAQLSETLQQVTGPTGSRVTSQAENLSTDEIDPATIDQLSAVLGPQQLGDLIDIFVADHSPRVERIGKTIKEGNLAALSREVHDLKGTCGNMGFVGIATLAQEVHDACKADDIGLAAHKLKGLPAMNDNVIAWLDKRKKMLPDATNE